MKKITLIFILLFSIFSFGQLRTNDLTAASPWTINIQSEWLQITVIDTGSVADTVFVYFPHTVGSTTSYARIGKIMDLSTGENVTAMISSATALTKTYILWLPHPRAVRFALGISSTGSVYIKAEGKPN